MTQSFRIKREVKTIRTMILMYCHDLHNTRYGDLCNECTELDDYSKKRLDKCPFQENKTICAVCPVHCYKPEMRNKIRAVMRYAGPKMMIRHPIMALRHSMDRLRKKPASGT